MRKFAIQNTSATNRQTNKKRHREKASGGESGGAAGYCNDKMLGLYHQVAQCGREKWIASSNCCILVDQYLDLHKNMAYLLRFLLLSKAVLMV
jgi:hypothetical protein